MVYDIDKLFKLYFQFFQLLKYLVLRNSDYGLGRLKLAFLCLVLVLFILSIGNLFMKLAVLKVSIRLYTNVHLHCANI